MTHVAACLVFVGQVIYFKIFLFLLFKKVLSNSEDLKIKNWLIEEPNIEEADEHLENVIFKLFFHSI
jgi:hypothetical protein